MKHIFTTIFIGNFYLLCCLGQINSIYTFPADTVLKLNEISYLQSLIPWNEQFLFYTQNIANPGLWISDGTEEQTQYLQRNLVIDPRDIQFSDALEKQLVFTASLHPFGRELWKTDGTIAGTRILIDLNPGHVSSYPTGLQGVNGKIFFFARSDVNGYGIFSTDGTESGTIFLKSIARQAQFTEGNTLTPFENGVYFFDYEDDNSYKIYQSDGTKEGTFALDFSLNKKPSELKIFQSKLYFVVEGDDRFDLHVYESSNDSLTLLYSSSALILEANSVRVVSTREKIYLIFQDEFSGGNSEVSILDITNVNERPVLLYTLDNQLLNAFPETIVPYLNGLVFTTRSTFGEDSIKFHYISPNNQLPLVIETFPQSIDPEFIEILDDQYFFLGSNSLYQGDTSRISLVQDLIQNPNKKIFLGRNFTTIEKGVVALGRDEEKGFELHLYNPDEGNVQLVKELDIDKVYLTRQIDQFSDKNNGVIFTNNISFSPTEIGQNIWHLPPGAEEPQFLTKYQRCLDFEQSNNVQVFQNQIIYTERGYREGLNSFYDKCRLIKINLENYKKDSLLFDDQRTIRTSSKFNDKIVFKDALYFSLVPPRDPSSIIPSFADELWKTNGTIEGTQLVKDINTHPQSELGACPQDYIVVDDLLLFSAFTDSFGRELWRTDGTEEGTFMLKDIAPSQAKSSIGGRNRKSIGFEKAKLGKKLIFVADQKLELDQDRTGEELWVSNGTKKGTFLLKDIVPGEIGSNPGGFMQLKDQVLFIVQKVLSIELWKTNGTQDGTILIKSFDYKIDFPNVSTLSVKGKLAHFVYDGFLYFRMFENTSGGELWRTDGTPAGTHLFKDLYPGSGSSDPRSPLVTESGFYFIARDTDEYFKVWRSDGTPENTQVIAEWEEEMEFVNPEGLFTIDEKIFFNATHRTLGETLYSFSPSGITSSIQQAKVSSLALYPNPTRGVFRVGTPFSSSEIIDLFVYDLQGTLLFQSSYSVQSGEEILIDLTNVSAGLKLVEMKQNGKSFYGKIVVKP